MKKTVLALAVGASLGAAAAQADVKLGGTFNVSVDSIKGCTTAYSYNATTDVLSGCADNSNNLNVSSNASNIVITATEDLGGGLKGVASFQEFVRADNNSGGTQLTGGNTYVGLTGSWGGFFAGNHDSGAKLNGRAFDLFGNQIGDSRNADMNNNRVSNLFWYQLPSMGGFSGMVGYSTNVGYGPATVAGIDDFIGAAAVSGGVFSVSPDTGFTTDNSHSMITANARWTAGPLTIGVGLDTLKEGDAFGTAGAKGDQWMNLGVKYSLPTGTDLIFVYQDHDNVLFDDQLSIKTMGIGVAQKFGGNNTLKVQFYRPELDFDGDKFKPDLVAVGFDHAFSKTFTGYIAYAKTSQDDGTNLSMAGGGHGDNPGTAFDEDMSGFSVGAIVKF